MVLEVDKTLSSLSIGIIVSVCLLFVTCILLFFVFYKKKNNQNNIEDQANAKKPTKKRFQLFRTDKASDNTPNTSSLDSNEIFHSLIEYPPTPIIPHNSNFHSETDPISLSLARQNREKRAGYYKNPSRTFVPYYCNQSNRLNQSSREDEDTRVMQRWSASSYHVW